MTVNEALKSAERQLRKTSLSSGLDAEVLLSFVLSSLPFSPSRRGKGGVGRGWLYANQDYEIQKPVARRFIGLLNKRRRGWPVAYLTGHKEFFGLDFVVTPDVLIPRPETELLVELALQATTYKLPATIIDIGTGSGNIIITLAKKLREYTGLVQHTPKFYGVDFSEKALKIARLNARRHDVADKIKFLRGHLLEPSLLSTDYRLRSTLIIANLPYLTIKQLNNLTIKHEPRRALSGGRDGLKYFRELFGQLSVVARSKRRSNPTVSQQRSFADAQDDAKTVVLLEHDPSQKERLKKLAAASFPEANIKFYKDLAGHFRVCGFSINFSTNNAN